MCSDEHKLYVIAVKRTVDRANVARDVNAAKIPPLTVKGVVVKQRMEWFL